MKQGRGDLNSYAVADFFTDKKDDEIQRACNENQWELYNILLVFHKMHINVSHHSVSLNYVSIILNAFYDQSSVGFIVRDQHVIQWWLTD